MNEPEDDCEETAPREPTAKPELSPAERVFVRMTLWQTVLSVLGIVIAVIALYAALKESAAVRQQTAAAVWPFVQLSIEDFDTGDAAGFSLQFVNVGVGPARLRSLRIEIDGAPARNWIEAVARVGGDADAAVSRNFIAGRVLRPDEAVELIGTGDAELARRFRSAMSSPGNFVSYCYCSIFDQCWMADSRRDLQEHDSVGVCPDFGGAAFAQ